MTAAELKRKRTALGLSGQVFCQKAGIGRTRLSDIECGHVQPSDAEIARITEAIAQLRKAKRMVKATASHCGWPTSAFLK